MNFALGYILSASCVLPSVNFYQQLLATTIAPFVVATGLVLTYYMAKRRAGIGSARVMAKRAAWSRHVTAGLLLSFLVSMYVRFLASEEQPSDGEMHIDSKHVKPWLGSRSDPLACACRCCAVPNAILGTGD